MGVRVFTCSVIRKGLPEAELQDVVDKFRAYKTSKDPTSFFGRDVSFNRPEPVVSTQLQHVHLNDGQSWGVRVVQFNRKSDMHLVYCQGWRDPECFLLITLVKGAHAKYRDTLYMLGLADIAADFRGRF